ncbi:16S rRNA methyltransferase [Tengunoibacter tsumagoiensis]|uniref:16S rRNA (guanine(1405)-N(7))-methyltransferase n=1 Tax=Tengunoibacter tsumagoiensis TaxID=2014871 RepID=A0A402A5A2_9CHLR|nr:16S rRNA methyltransferase [Tengunoibacter tsumagoiensis]GCE14290.1 16S rRNA methyltransferase [Tengunoibacter tsumagoiensis]
MSNKEQDLIALLVQQVLSSSKQRDVSPDLVQTIGAQELAKRRNLKEALKATKNKLHQIGGAYLDDRSNYAVWLSTLQEALLSGDEQSIKQASSKIMHGHASTRERIPILAQFYTTLLLELPPIHRVLDIACGLNPLAIPWMCLPPHVEYYAYDIYQQMTDFLNTYLSLAHIPGYAETCNVITHCPAQTADVAFILKALPCLEQVDKQASYRLLRQIQARYLIVSFPVQSLGGRGKGMAAFYEAHFRQLVADEAWEIKRYEFATELVFLVDKGQVFA